MPNTYSQLYIQIVFAVQGREYFIAESFRERLQQYITGIVKNQGQKMLSIYCMPDHTHMLVSIKPDIAISELVRDVKSNSCSFIKNELATTFSWQKGFGAFSYSKSQLNDVARYIASQPAHHQKQTFRENILSSWIGMRSNMKKNICLNFIRVKECFASTRLVCILSPMLLTCRSAGALNDSK
jgi:putative transposase